MGMPQTIINFQTLAATLITRTENGIVALILKDDTATESLYSYNSIEEVKVADKWSDDNIAYINQVFKGGPKRIYVARVGSSTPALNDALVVLGNRKWDYLAYPDGTSEEMSTLETWIKTRRNTDKKTYKAVLGSVTADHEGIENFTTVGIKVGSKTYDNSKFTARIAGILAGVSTEGSVTNYALPEVDSITDLADDTARNAAIDGGQLILVNDGEDVVIARGVNSLTTVTTTKGAVFKKIRIVEIVDTMRDDITVTINKDYKGKVINSYANKLLLAGAINAYFGALERENILDSEYDNLAEIDYEAQRTYLSGIGIKVDDLTEAEILKFNTNDQVFIKCSIKTLDAMEDFHFQIYL